MRDTSRKTALAMVLILLTAFTCGAAPDVRGLMQRVKQLEKSVDGLRADVAELQARPGGIGVGELAVSTGSAVAVEGEPPVVIPGLERTLTITEGANLLVMVDVREWAQFVHGGCEGYVDGRRGRVDLEVDGLRVASREFFGDFGNLSNVLSHTLVWLSKPLSGGTHSIRALISAPAEDGDIRPGETTSCIGVAGDDGRQARMVILELLE